MSKIISELKFRGLLQDATDEAAIDAFPAGTGVYVGFDPTAPALHVGNYLMLITALHLARAGFAVHILFGGATGSIGDPSGRSSERNLLSLEEVGANVERISRKVSQIFERAGVSVNFVNNYDWTKEVSLLHFLRDIGKHFTVNYMLGKEVVKTRLSGEGISYTEFSYMLLQAFDFYHLFSSCGVKMQFGGSDQWGNITGGLELIRRKTHDESAQAFSVPLILDSQGKKLGKSTGGGGVWIDGAMTSPYHFHQYWLNIADADVIKCLKAFTFLSEEEISELEKSVLEHPEKRIAQNRLADEVCTTVHGVEATEEAKRCAKVLFGGSLEQISEDALKDIFKEAPATSITRAELESFLFADLLAVTLCKSKGEARRLVASGGAYLNNERIEDAQASLSSSRWVGSSILVLRSGKKNYHLVQVTE